MDGINSRVLESTKVLSTSQKEANDKQWYKDKIQLLDTGTSRNTYNTNGLSEYHRMKVNYDLYNNILDLSDFEYVTKPFGGEVGELPAKMVNRDIISNKIKVILGLESARPFEYKIIAVNPEATTRKEEKEFSMIRDYVINSIIEPIRKELEVQQQEKLKGKKLSEEEIAEINAQVEEQLKTMTPPEIKTYMERNHLDIAEVQAQHLLEYLLRKEKLERKFNIGMKHAAIAAKEFYWVGDVNGEPSVRVCNPLRCNYDKSPETEFVEDGEWFTYEYRMTPSQVVAFFADELTKKEIDDIYLEFKNYLTRPLTEDLFTFSKNTLITENSNTIRVLHCVWRALREVQFLTYTDEEGNIQQTIVDETYKFNPEAGDIDIHTEYLPEIYEGYKIGVNTYKRLRPLPGQFRDMDNLYNTPLPYYGAIYDADNSLPTSLLDRGKIWQYFLNIVYYRLELVLASDKGKKVLMNLNAIPDSVGLDITKFKYFMETSPYGWLDPNQEGTGYNDMNTVAKVIDLSTASDIAKYVELAEKIKRECGEAMGISPQMEAQIAQRDAVENTKQILQQNSLMLEPFFSLHDLVKRNVLNALINQAKISYAKSKPKKLSYVLDDMSVKSFDFDFNLLENSTLGLFISNSGEVQRMKDTLLQLSQVALQNQQATYKDIISIMKEPSISEAENILEKSQKESYEREMNKMQQEQNNAKELEKIKEDAANKQHEREKELIVLKESERRETEIQKISLVGASYNPELDKDNDGENDFIEIARKGLETEIKQRKQNLDERKFELEKQVKKEELDIKRAALNKRNNSKK